MDEWLKQPNSLVVRHITSLSDEFKNLATQFNSIPGLFDLDQFNKACHSFGGGRKSIEVLNHEIYVLGSPQPCQYFQHEPHCSEIYDISLKGEFEHLLRVEFSDQILLSSG